MGYRQVRVVWPTTTRLRLAVLAHELGHVLLERSKTPTALPPASFFRLLPEREYAAERFAWRLLRSHGISVPRAVLRSGRENVLNHLYHCDCWDRTPIDPAIVRWAGMDLGTARFIGIIDGPPVTDLIDAEISATLPLLDHPEPFEGSGYRGLSKLPRTIQSDAPEQRGRAAAQAARAGGEP